MQSDRNEKKEKGHRKREVKTGERKYRDVCIGE